MLPRCFPGAFGCRVCAPGTGHPISDRCARLGAATPYGERGSRRIASSRPRRGPLIAARAYKKTSGLGMSGGVVAQERRWHHCRVPDGVARPFSWNVFRALCWRRRFSAVAGITSRHLADRRSFRRCRRFAGGQKRDREEAGGNFDHHFRNSVEALGRFSPDGLYNYYILPQVGKYLFCPADPRPKHATIAPDSSMKIGLKWHLVSSGWQLARGSGQSPRPNQAPDVPARWPGPVSAG